MQVHHHAHLYQLLPVFYMNLDHIIRLANEAGLWLDSEGNIAGGQLDSAPRFAALVAAAEREACAKVVERDTALMRQALAALQGYASSIQLRKNQIKGKKAILALYKRLETRHDRSDSN